MSTSINQHFTPWALLKFAFPSIVMMLFMSLYTIVDGVFISRFLGSNALSSLNIVFPVINVVIAIATMLGTGGNAVISKYLGEGRDRDARECLTQFVLLGLFVSLLLLVLTQVFLTPLCRLLGSTDILLTDCQAYLSVSLLFAPACMLQTMFQSYLVTAGKPALGLVLTVGAGILNAVLDYVLIVTFGLGIAGAALATGIGQSVPAAAGLCFFFFTKKTLRFTKLRLHIPELLQACCNGSSEMVTQLSNAIITFLFNIILLQLAGEAGVAAITILLYGQFAFNAFYLGFSIGISPIVGFQYGARNHRQLRSIYRTSFLFVTVSSLALTAAAILLSTPLVSVFTHEPETFQLADTGFRIFSVNFLFSGFNIASSGFFTALSNGKVSAIISFLRTCVFIVLALLTLPRFLDVTGAWLAIPVAELMTLLLSLYFHRIYFKRPGRKNYLLPAEP
ncbi:MATE family efflux transporter [Anaerosacchariphilus sp. NSJ-68]|uniref:Multidrug export protein MepA n=2 Tax=Lachnospiraceae TaxID=186803 RepID=A0A923LAL4_9FIRM|nr:MULTISPECIES: MATE family efflux transporter [Lachnospiraceae]MBC5658768.1 MATE family efflux transporter [Anaerosacchariphilus hominis]MBC5698963.1 MATE family efflux transporter [Roseburia difficilis]